MYGCHNKNQPLTCREFPYIFDQTSKYFNYSHCNFCVQKCKEGSARVSLWKLLKNPNIFTLETSFCGSSKKKSKGKPFQYLISDYHEIGKDFCKALLLHFCSITVEKKRTKKREKSLQIQSKCPMSVIEEVQTKKQEFKEDIHDSPRSGILSNLKKSQHLNLEYSEGSDSERIPIKPKKPKKPKRR